MRRKHPIFPRSSDSILVRGFTYPRRRWMESVPKSSHRPAAKSAIHAYQRNADRCRRATGRQSPGRRTTGHRRRLRPRRPALWPWPSPARVPSRPARYRRRARRHGQRRPDAVSRRRRRRVARGQRRQGLLKATTDTAGPRRRRRHHRHHRHAGRRIPRPVGRRIRPLDRQSCSTGSVPASLLVLRSTVFPGVTDRLARQLEQRGRGDVDLAYCPERIVQGQSLEELEQLPQLVGGATQRCRRPGRRSVSA